MTTPRNRPRRIGVGSPARSQVDADRGRLFRKVLQVLASGRTSGRDEPRTASTVAPFEGSNRGRATSGTCSCGVGLHDAGRRAPRLRGASAQHGSSSQYPVSFQAGLIDSSFSSSISRNKDPLPASRKVMSRMSSASAPLRTQNGP